MRSTLQVELSLCPSTGFELVSYSTHHFRMTSRGDDASTSTTKDVERADAGKSIEQLNEPDGVTVFSKEQFNVRLHFLLSSLFKQFLHFTKIPPAFLHLNVVRILIGCSILHQWSNKRICCCFGPLGSLYEHPDHPFEPCHSFGIPAQGGSRSTTSSITCPHSKKFVPRPVEKALDLSPSPFVFSSPSTSAEVGADQGSSDSPFVPPSDTVQPCLELVVRPPSESTCPAEDEVLAATSGSKAKEKDVPAIPSSWEEIAVLLKAIPCFIAPEPLASGVEEFFTFSHRHFVNLSGIPRITGMV
ncbi:hypothetical protein AAG906_034270 [Vitis piasezkii]